MFWPSFSVSQRLLNVFSLFSTGSADGAGAERSEGHEEKQTVQNSKRKPAVSSSTNQKAPGELQEWVQLNQQPLAISDLTSLLSSRWVINPAGDLSII